MYEPYLFGCVRKYKIAVYCAQKSQNSLSTVPDMTYESATASVCASLSVELPYVR